MTTKPKVRKFRIRRLTPLTEGLTPPSAESAAPTAVLPRSTGPRMTNEQLLAALQNEQISIMPDDGQDIDSRALVTAEQDMDQIRREGLTGRQLRMARRVAQKNGLAVTSDFDAVRQLRALGIDPFKPSNILELVTSTAIRPADQGNPPDDMPRTIMTMEGRIQLPQTVPGGTQNLPSTESIAPADRRVQEIMKIQQDIAARRRRNVMMLMARLAVFVGLPTLLVGWYFYMIATPMYATKTEFVIQQASPVGGAGLGGLFQGTSMATQQDSITVQSYLTSRAAMVRLDEEEGFKQVFSDPAIDPIQRLPEDASSEDAFRIYQNHVRIGYDPTEGIIRMEVIAPNPQTSQAFSEALIHYAEEQVDHLTQRLREDQMAGARASYEDAEERRAEALAEWLRVQESVQQIDPIGETAAKTAQISALESQRQQLELDLQSKLAVPRPNEAQVNALKGQINDIESLIAQLRSEMTQDSAGATSLASQNTELRTAEENYTFQTLIVQQALTQMEVAQVEANRQVRYLSMGVEPVAPDEATYPQAFENTILAFLVFAGLYLMISLTASILREQVSG
ncbi:MAG: capsule biosynthesis protein [Rhodobacterales bacterium]|nr:capsule biosynthesis protein [Rhodobacterales bacterium]